ncbi:MAG: glycoside hydrolase family 5 protein [Treponema sp.]|nr:glycoside hydrolase family 5 protein [Candidatus Treponema equifaecale]
MKLLSKCLSGLFCAMIFLNGTSCLGAAEIEDDSKFQESLANPSSSVNFALKMKAGWNLGNTFDAYNNKDEMGYTLSAETCWGMPKTTRKMIQAVHKAGFSTIRIPVSWHGHLSNNPEDPYKIDSKWMARVKEVVNWAYNEGMYVILNIHHDNLSTAQGNGAGTINASGYNGNKLLGYVVDSGFKRQSKFFLKNVWEQICKNFNEEYDEHLIFELLNEPRNVGTADEWWVSNTTKLAEYNKILLEYEQTCLDVIRASGNKNATRYVMVTGYAANPQLTVDFTLPNDSANDKLLLSFHAYTPYKFAMWDQSNPNCTVFDKGCQGEIEWNYQQLRQKFPTIGIVQGETSAENKDNLSERLKWAEFAFGQAYKKYKIASVLWDNNVPSPDSNHNGEHHGYFNREKLEWYFPTLTQKMVEACK